MWWRLRRTRRRRFRCSWTSASKGSSCLPSLCCLQDHSPAGRSGQGVSLDTNKDIRRLADERSAFCGYVLDGYHGEHLRCPIATGQVERSAKPGVGARVRGDHLDSDVRPLGQFREMDERVVHDLWGADEMVQHGLVDYGYHLR